MLHSAGTPPSVQKYVHNSNSCCRLRMSWTHHEHRQIDLQSMALIFFLLRSTRPAGAMPLQVLLQQSPTLHPQQQPTFYPLNSCVSSFSLISSLYSDHPSCSIKCTRLHPACKHASCLSWLLLCSGWVGIGWRQCLLQHQEGPKLPQAVVPWGQSGVRLLLIHQVEVPGFIHTQWQCPHISHILVNSSSESPGETGQTGADA